MKKDFELLKKDTKVVYNGIPTKIESCRIFRTSWMYEGTDEEAEATQCDFYDSTGTHFYELDVNQMTPDMVDWNFDYVRLDTKNLPLYLQDLDEFVCLTDIDIEHDIFGLSDEQLKQLRREICAGSIYYADYNNDKFINRNVLLYLTEAYLEWCDRETAVEDNPEAFAYYIKNIA